MSEEKNPFYIIIGKKDSMSQAKSKLVKYFLQNKKHVKESNIFEFIGEEINLENADSLIKECKSVLERIIIILLPINTTTGSDGKTKDKAFKQKLKTDDHLQSCYSYKEFLTSSSLE
jgi:hypothetical protein